jgi:3-mercaptopropionate dioxygenase
MNMLASGVSLDSFVSPIARAVRDDRVTSLACVLARLRERDAFTTEMFLPPHPDHYTRKLIWRDPQDHFVIVGMTWAPRQGSPLHDHDGLWGAEIVVDGIMSETIFTLVGRGSGERYRFERGMRRESGRGALGVLIPPHEYHDFGNDGETVAHSVHVYGGNLSGAHSFTEGADGWWTSRRVSLRYDG